MNHCIDSIKTHVQRSHNHGSLNHAVPTSLGHAEPNRLATGTVWLCKMAQPPSAPNPPEPIKTAQFGTRIVPICLIQPVRTRGNPVRVRTGFLL